MSDQPLSSSRSKPKPRDRGSRDRNPTTAAIIKKRRIKEVAVRMFAERGVAAVGLSSIGMCADLPNRGVNYYYRNREDLLTDILVEHVITLTRRIGAAHDATADASPATRLEAMVLAFHTAVLAAPDAHRAMLFNTALLPPKWQVSVRGRYRYMLEVFVETLVEAVPALAPRDAGGVLLPALERLLGGSVFWFDPAAAPVSADVAARTARMVTGMALGAAHQLVADPAADTGEAEAYRGPDEWLAPLRPEFSPRTAWANYSAARNDVGAGEAAVRDTALDAAARTARQAAAFGEAERLPARQALRRWYEILPEAAAGREFLITCRDWPVARLGPAGDGKLSR